MAGKYLEVLNEIFEVAENANNAMKNNKSINL